MKTHAVKIKLYTETDLIYAITAKNFVVLASFRRNLIARGTKILTG